MEAVSNINKRSNNHIENRIFWDTFIVMLLNELSSIGASFVDVLLTNRFYDEVAVAAEGIVTPFYSIIGLISGTLIYGTQKICIRYLGNGNKEKAQSSFNTTLFAGILGGLVATIIFFFFAGPIVSILGAKPENVELYNTSLIYLKGMSIGVIALILVPILSPISQVEGYKISIKLSLITIVVVDVVADLTACLLHLDMFYMGLATSIAQWCGLFVLYLPFIKNSFFRVNVGWCNSKELVLIIKEGVPKLVKRLCKIIKPVTINAMILAIGGVAGMGTVSIRNSFSGLLESIGAALGCCIGMLSPLYIGEKNIFALKRLIKSSKKALFLLLTPISIVVFIFARNIAFSYAKDNLEIYNYVTTAIKCVSIDLILMAIIELLMCYWQAIGKIKEASAVTMLQKLVLPIVCTIILSNIFGIDGIWYSFPAASFLTIMSFFVLSLLMNINNKKKQKDLLFIIPDELLSEKKFQSDITIDSISDVSSASEMIRNECIKAGIETKRAYHIALCFEEVVCNIIEHGFKKDNKKHHYIDVFITIEETDVILRIRDDCTRFDMVKKFEVFHPVTNDPLKLIGIRIVMKLAKDINYVNTFNTNSVIIKI